ncbi:MAG: hypothetical protein WA628_06565 [Terriglobales bacterium]
MSAFFLALISYNFVDIDIWHQMGLIRESLPAGHLLKSDPYAYTPTLSPWIDHEWGAGAIAFFMSLWFGGRAILVVKFLMAWGTGFLCVRCSEKMGTDFRLLGACAPLAIFLAHLGFFTAVRAQVYTFFFAALLMFFWQFDRAGTRGWMVAWLVLFPLWVNLHGGFVVGVGLMVLYGVEKLLRGENVRFLLLALAGMLLETFLTPYGMAYFGYLRRALVMARPYAPEWRPVWDLGPAWVIFFTTAVAIVIYSVLSTGFRDKVGILPLAATAFEATLHRKLLPLFAVAWICFAPSYLQPTAAGRWIVDFTRRRSRFAIAVWVSLTCVCLVAAIRQKPWDISVPQPIYPVGPVQYLREQNFKGNVMVPFRLGAYLSWKLFPAVKVSLDGRYEETYPDEVIENIFRLYEARPGWQAVLDAYPTDVVLVPRDSPVAGKVASTGWQEVYQDREFVLYARPGRSLPPADRRSSTFAGVFP